jgi:hypothetical protein
VRAFDCKGWKAIIVSPRCGANAGVVIAQQAPTEPEGKNAAFRRPISVFSPKKAMKKIF